MNAHWARSRDEMIDNDGGDGGARKGRLLIIYHFFFPDDVVSSRHFSDFAEGLAVRGWDVTVLTSNRICRQPKARMRPECESWRGVRIHRSPRPAFSQASNAGRLLNSLWLIGRWAAFIARRPAFDAIVLGTDPAFGYFLLPAARLLKPRTKLLYWGFDLYPEAVIADDSGIASKLASALRPLTRACYSTLDGIADIGPCMRQVLDGYGHRAARATLVPWALAEPDAPLIPDPEARRELFGDAKLTILYSGTIGKAHEFDCFIALARELRIRGASVSFCFAGRGNRYDELRRMIGEEDTNISFADFSEESKLEKRLSSGDIHMISLRRGWEGIVVPSKFFGSLAAGRPLLYQGSEGSSVRTWIEKFRIGYCLDRENTIIIADELCRLADDPRLLRDMQRNARECYAGNFSKKKVLDGWDAFIRKVLSAPK
jgi:colanic acid biosynthesis glycosyl transferase WcaI